MTERTPDEWLPILTKKMDADRPRIDRLRAYVTGNAPLPELSSSTRESWKNFQKRARTALAQLIVSAMSDRMNPIGALLTLGLVTQAQGEEYLKQAQRYMRDAWTEKRLGVILADAIWDSLAVSISYLMVARDEDGQPVMTAEKPEFMYADPDPLKPWIARAGIKIWRGDDGNDYAFVWVPGARQKYQRPSKTRNGRIMVKATGGWEKVGEPTESPQQIPIFILANRENKGEFEDHTDVIDRIHLGNLWRLVITAYQAFKQRAIEGDLEEVDENGNPIDWGQILAAAPGALWQMPAGAKVWESGNTDITPLLSAVKDDTRELCAATSTPVPTMLPDGANQTVDGSLAAREGLLFKIADRLPRMSPTMGAALKAFLIIGMPEFVGNVQVEFAKPHMATQSEKAQAAVTAKAADVPWRTRMRDFMGYSHEEIDAMELERAAEMLQLDALVNPVMTPTADGVAAAPAPVEDPAAVKAKAEAMGILIRAGVVAESAAAMVGLNSVEFSGAMPTSLRLPAADAAALE